MSVNYVLYAISVLYDGVRLRNFTIDGGHSGFQRVPIVLHRSIPKLRRHNLQYLPPEPSLLGHGMVRKPVRCNLLQTWMDLRRYEGCLRLARHGCLNHACYRVPKLTESGRAGERKAGA